MKMHRTKGNEVNEGRMTLGVWGRLMTFRDDTFRDLRSAAVRGQETFAQRDSGIDAHSVYGAGGVDGRKSGLTRRRGVAKWSWGLSRRRRDAVHRALMLSAGGGRPRLDRKETADQDGSEKGDRQSGTEDEASPVFHGRLANFAKFEPTETLSNREVGQ
jgi:hypothetical protein